MIEQKGTIEISESPKQIEVAIINKLPPIDKIAKFDLDGLTYHIIATDNILIELPDHTIELNVYGQLFKIIAKVHDNKNQLKLESTIFNKDDYTLELWNDEVNKIIAKAKEFFHELSKPFTMLVRPIKY